MQSRIWQRCLFINNNKQRRRPGVQMQFINRLYQYMAQTVYSICMSKEKAPLGISAAHCPMVPLPTNARVSFKKLHAPLPPPLLLLPLRFQLQPPLPPPLVWVAYMGGAAGIYMAKWAASNSPTIAVGLSLFTLSTSLFYVSFFPASFA